MKAWQTYKYGMVVHVQSGMGQIYECLYNMKNSAEQTSTHLVSSCQDRLTVYILAELPEQICDFEYSTE